MLFRGVACVIIPLSVYSQLLTTSLSCKNPARNELKRFKMLFEPANYLNLASKQSKTQCSVYKSFHLSSLLSTWAFISFTYKLLILLLQDTIVAEVIVVQVKELLIFKHLDCFWSGGQFYDVIPWTRGKLFPSSIGLSARYCICR